MHRRVPVAKARKNVPQLNVGYLYRFTFSNAEYRPTTVVAVVTASMAKDVLTVSRVESYEATDSRAVLPLGATLTLDPGVVTAEMMIPDQPIPSAE